MTSSVVGPQYDAALGSRIGESNEGGGMRKFADAACAARDGAGDPDSRARGARSMTGKFAGLRARRTCRAGAVCHFVNNQYERRRAGDMHGLRRFGVHGDTSDPQTPSSSYNDSVHGTFAALLRVAVLGTPDGCSDATSRRAPVDSSSREHAARSSSTAARAAADVAKGPELGPLRHSSDVRPRARGSTRGRRRPARAHPSGGG